MSETAVDEDAPNKTYTISSVGSELHAGFIASEIEAVIDEASSDLAANIRMIKHLICYLAGTYYTDAQRNTAKAELFRLQQERAVLEATIQNSLFMASELLEPVTVNT